MSREFDCMREFVRDALERASSYEWSVQGFGMMRTYIGTDHRFRLNVWHSKLAVQNVSTIHDHPWDLVSWIISGRLRNRRYEVGSGIPFQCMELEPGAEGGPRSVPEEVFLFQRPTEIYFPGSRYEQRADEVHVSLPDDGTVTLNDRTGHGEDRARVFWLSGGWVDAKPRPATPWEVVLYSSLALEGMGGMG
jgi:hypothetical protein